LIAEAPFDRGIKLPIRYDVDYIDLFLQQTLPIYDISERKYTVKLIDNDSFILTTKNEYEQTIYDHFINNAIRLKVLRVNFIPILYPNSEIAIPYLSLRNILLNFKLCESIESK